MTAPATKKSDMVRVSEIPAESFAVIDVSGNCSRPCGTNTVVVDDDFSVCPTVEGGSMVGVFDGKNTFVVVGVLVGVKAFGSMTMDDGPTVGTVVGLKVLVIEGAGIGFSVGGPVHVLKKRMFVCF